MKKLSRVGKQFVKKNGATILTGVGAAGVIGTAILTSKGTTKASLILSQAKLEKGEELTTKEKLILATPSYIPALTVGAGTIACIVGANVLNKHHQASLIGAYTMLDQSIKQYKKKVNELYGEQADDKIEEEIAKDSYIPYEPEKELFYDVYSKRYFEAKMEDVLAAETATNRLMTTGWGVGLNEFYELLGLKGISEFSELGWSSYMMEDMYWHAWIEFDHNKTIMEDGNECIMISFPLPPFVDYLE